AMGCSALAVASCGAVPAGARPTTSASMAAGRSGCGAWQPRASASTGSSRRSMMPPRACAPDRSGCIGCRGADGADFPRILDEQVDRGDGGGWPMNAFVGELVGTALLILLGDGVVAAALLARSKAQNAGWLAITWGWAVAVFVGVFTAARL